MCASYSTCSACIADPNCGYCSVIPYSSSTVNSTQTAAGLSGCPSVGCYADFVACMPIGNGAACCPNYPARWETGSSAIRSLQVGFPVNPSAATIYLKPGSTVTLPIAVTSPVTDDLSIDLMLLQDLSGSFKNDLQAFANLVPQLVIGVKKINTDTQFGLASFVEVPLEPFGLQSGVTGFQAEGDTNTWNWPIFNATGCALPTADALMEGCSQHADAICPIGDNIRAATTGAINWRYCMEAPLNADYTKLQARMLELAIGRVAHNNLDYPEPSLDGMFYASKCHANWRPRSRKVLTVVTDARYHGTSPETCSLLSPPDARKGSATCTIGVNTGAGSWFSTGYFETDFDEDCILDARSGVIPAWNAHGPLPVLNNQGQNVAPTVTWTYPQTARRDALLPGTKEAFVNKDVVSAALRSKGIVPLIACSEDPTSTILPLADRQNLWYWEDLVAEWGFGFAKLLVKPSSGRTNLVDLILAAIADISKTMQMVIENTVDPSSTRDALNYVTNIDPASQQFPNVQAGERNTFLVDFLVPLGQTTVGGYVIKFTILGYGDCLVTISNQTTCQGCQGDPEGLEDMCGFCDPPPGGANQCVDCAGVAGGRSVYDLCGVCGGNNDQCTDCRGLAAANSNYAVDPCGVCTVIGSPTWGQSCLGCDGQLYPGGNRPLNDLCGVCGGTDACLLCDDGIAGEVSFSAFVDDCGVCITVETERSDTCRVASAAISAGAAAGIAIGIALFVALAVIAVIIIVAKVTKNFIDERKFMNAFAAGNTVGTNPLHKDKAGWKDNAIAN